MYGSLIHKGSFFVKKNLGPWRWKWDQTGRMSKVVRPGEQPFSPTEIAYRRAEWKNRASAK
jgi:hypothetical protein